MFSKTFIVIGMVIALSYTVTRNFAYGDEYCVGWQADLSVSNASDCSNYLKNLDITSALSLSYVLGGGAGGSINHVSGGFFEKNGEVVPQVGRAFFAVNDQGASVQVVQYVVGREQYGRRSFEAVTIIKEISVNVQKISADGDAGFLEGIPETRGKSPKTNMIDTDFSGGLSDTVKIIKNSQKKS